ncbi:MAG: Ldh family oxidoreductase [Candidatus Poribacteria bacterium]
MSNRKAHIYISADELRDIATEILKKEGVPEGDAFITADCLVKANLRGIDTHGVIRLKVYVDRLRAGGNNPTPDIRVIHEGATTAVMDGDNGLGPPGGVRAMEKAIEKAQSCGVGIVTMRNSNHYGAAAFYAMMALEHNMIGISMTNVLAGMPPTGGRQARIGNNPFALAFPAGEELPIVFDAATSLSSWGKVFLAAQTGALLAEGCFLDKDGNPTVNPEDVISGGLLLPIAGYKGYGMALCVGILTGLLADGSFDIDVPHPYKYLDAPGANSFFMSAIQIEQFVPIEQFKKRIDEIVRVIRDTPLAPNAERIYLPGEKEHIAERERMAKGIPLNRETIEELKMLARETSVVFPQL